MTKRLAAVLMLTACAGQAQVVNVWPGAAPGSEHWTQQERFGLEGQGLTTPP